MKESKREEEEEEEEEGMEGEEDCEGSGKFKSFLVSSSSFFKSCRSSMGTSVSYLEPYSLLKRSVEPGGVFGCGEEVLEGVDG